MSRTFLDVHADITRLLEEYREHWESVSHKTAIITILDAAGIAWQRAPITADCANAILIESDVEAEISEEDRACAGCEDCDRTETDHPSYNNCDIPPLTLNLYFCFDGYDRLVCFKVMP